MKIEDLSLIKRIFEAALLAAEKPMMRRDLVALFDDLEAPTDELIDQAITELACLLEVLHMSWVKNVKATVGHDDGFTFVFGVLSN